MRRCRRFHPRRSFRCQSTLPCASSGSGRVGGAGGCPTIRARIVSPAGVRIAAAISSTPDNHFTASPHCRVTSRAVGALVVLVAVQLSVLGLYLPPVFKSPSVISSTPDDHFTASPHCRVKIGQRARWWCWWLSNYPCWDCISRRCSRSRRQSYSAPDDHFTASPHCRVISRPAGALVVLVAVQLSVLGLYLPPVFK